MFGPEDETVEQAVSDYVESLDDVPVIQTSFGKYTVEELLTGYIESELED